MSLAKEKFSILSTTKMPIYFAFQKGKKRKVTQSWQIVLFGLFRLQLGGLSVCIDSWSSEINSALTVGDLNRVVWKVGAAYHSVFRSGLSWQALWGKLFWLCYRNHPAEAGSVLQLAGVTSAWVSLTWLSVCVSTELSWGGNKGCSGMAAAGWGNPWAVAELLCVELLSWALISSSHLCWATHGLSRGLAWLSGGLSFTTNWINTKNTVTFSRYWFNIQLVLISERDGGIWTNS